VPAADRSPPEARLQAETAGPPRAPSPLRSPSRQPADGEFSRRSASPT